MCRCTPGRAVLVYAHLGRDDREGVIGLFCRCVALWTTANQPNWDFSTRRTGSHFRNWPTFNDRRTRDPRGGGGEGERKLDRFRSRLRALRGVNHPGCNAKATHIHTYTFTHIHTYTYTHTYIYTYTHTLALFTMCSSLLPNEHGTSGSN